mmetsp:Transcript_23006/g.25364  ORF Transcript_23006/g.25364 Transcript_23006/m.25364 type:complete len:386 (+) Transcript_23006:46-1203(+)
MTEEELKVENNSSCPLSNGLTDILQKVEGGLLPTITNHIELHEGKDCLDFLDAKNSLLLSYLIDLVQKNFIEDDDDDDESENDRTKERLLETKAALEKIRPMEKKMKYQLEKLLSDNSNSAKYAINGKQKDPLLFRPSIKAMKDGDDESNMSSSSGESDDDDDSSEDDDSNDENDDDDDLATARLTLKLAQQKKAAKAKNDNDGIYHAPRHESMPYPSLDDNAAEKQRRMNKKLRATELAHTLREKYGEAPEQEDLHGGTDYGKQRELSRKMDDMDKERTKFEEENFVRLVTSRKDKKERKRLMQQEGSNLAAIADIGNIVRNVNVAFGERKKKKSFSTEDTSSEQPKKKRRSGINVKNSLQKELFDQGDILGGSGKKKKKKKKR